MLATEGCRVSVLARTRASVDSDVQAIRREKKTAVGVCADVSEPEALDDATRQVGNEFGPPLIVIGQAIYQAPGDFAPGWIETDNAIAYLTNNMGLADEEQRRQPMLRQARVPPARIGKPYEIDVTHRVLVFGDRRLHHWGVD